MSEQAKQITNKNEEAANVSIDVTRFSSDAAAQAMNQRWLPYFPYFVDSSLEGEYVENVVHKHNKVGTRRFAAVAMFFFICTNALYIGALVPQL